jgi:hypothetical protein
MTWEDRTPMEWVKRLVRRDALTDGEAERKRSRRLRYFLTVWGAMHWADRVDRRRPLVARRGRIAL